MDGTWCMGKLRVESKKDGMVLVFYKVVWESSGRSGMDKTKLNRCSEGGRVG